MANRLVPAQAGVCAADGGGDFLLTAGSSLLQEMAPMLSRGEAVSFLEAACEMGHVGEPPTVSDFADCSMRLRRIFQASPATRKPPCLNQTVKRSVFFSQQGIGVSDADTGGSGHYAGIELGIRQSRFNGRTDVQHGERPCR